MDPFLEACGATGPLELLVEHADHPGAVRHVLHQPFAVLGRARNADAVLDDPEVSQRHVYLQLVGGRVFCVDLDSRTGVYWPDGRRRDGWLRPDEALAVGPFRVRVTAPAPDGRPPEATPLVRGALGVDSLPPVTLEFETRTPSRWRPNRVLTLAGRCPACKLMLE